MCGIAGIVGLEDQEQARSKIIQMTESLKHRGPDATGIYLDQGIALGHLRLSIIDLTEAANQPFFDRERRYSIVFNGEIYNYREIKTLLKDYEFRTDSDTEVILAAYQKFGHKCLSYLNGMFAFAIWDNVSKELFIARDRLGVKPLYYSQTKDGSLIFSSEMRAILNTGMVERKLNDSAVYEYLMYQSVYAPRTIVEGIFQLPAGEFGVYSNGQFAHHPYWRIEDKSREEIAEDETNVKKNVKELLLKSVERRMISDVQLGAFLSGGIDSSAIVALMAEISEKQVDTFSVTFEEEEFDESFYSDLIARKFNTNHTKVNLSASDFLNELPNALRATDSPSGDGINTYVVSKATKNSGITVALSGLGGDELFAGYPNFLKYYKLKHGLISKIPAFFRKPVALAAASSSNSRSQRLGNLLSASKINISNVYPLSRQVMSQRIVVELFDKNDRETQIQIALDEKLDSIEHFPELSQFSIAEMLGYTQNVLLKDTDQFSMASALEVREPFFDYQLVEYVLRIPDRFKYPKYPKSLLVEALYPHLPHEIVHRPKMGFVLPWANWMRGELKDFCESRLKILAERRILNSERLLSKWDEFINRRNGVLWSHLWHLVVLTEWLENNKF